MVNELYKLNINGKNELCLAGHIDVANVKQACNDGMRFINNLSEVNIDLSGLRYADSSSLAMLVEWIRCARTQHKSIVFKNTPQFMLDLGRVCGLDAILPIGKPLQFQN
jgi:anti-anti-sigma factor